MYRPIVNKIRCKFCGDIIESFDTHDFKQCKCGKCFTDGGHEYARRGFEGAKPDDAFEDLSIYVDTENQKIVHASMMSSDDIQRIKADGEPFEKAAIEAEDITPIPGISDASPEESEPGEVKLVHINDLTPANPWEPEDPVSEEEKKTVRYPHGGLYEIPTVVTDAKPGKSKKNR